MESDKATATFAGYKAVKGAGPGMWIVQDAYGIPARKKATGEKCYIKAWRDEGDQWTFFVGGKTAGMDDAERIPTDDIAVLSNGHSTPGAGRS